MKTSLFLACLLISLTGCQGIAATSPIGSRSAGNMVPAVDAKEKAVKFLGMMVEGKRVVFIVDRDLPTPKIFDSVRNEVVRTVNSFGQEQQFNAMLVGDFLWAAYPELKTATDAGKKDFTRKMAKTQATVSIGDRLPFDEAFAKAFEMKPDEIYLVADAWGFYPRLANEVKKLNAEQRVKVHAVAFVHHVRSDASYEKFMMEFEGQMEELAKANGGVFKALEEKDLGK